MLMLNEKFQYVREYFSCFLQKQNNIYSIIEGLKTKTVGTCI